VSLNHVTAYVTYLRKVGVVVHRGSHLRVGLVEQCIHVGGDLAHTGRTVVADTLLS
jgi:hypothetical protein